MGILSYIFLTGKSNHLLFKRCTVPLVQVKTGCIFLLLWIPLLLSAQFRADSFHTSYDSIQDVNLSRVRRNMERQLTETNERLVESNRTIDSLTDVLDGLKGRLEELEIEYDHLEDQFHSLQEQMGKRSEETTVYRKKLQGTLWIGGVTLLVLLISSFLFLLIYSLKTRWLLQRVQVRVKGLRKALRNQWKKIRDAPGMKKKRIRKIAGTEVKTRLKKLKLKKG